MRIYLAAPVAYAASAEALAARLRTEGHAIVSRWHAVVAAANTQTDPPEDWLRRAILKDNIHDLDACDVLVALTHEGSPRATFGEVAWVLGRGVSVVWVRSEDGRGRCIWDAHDNVHQVEVGPDGDAGAVERLVLVALADVQREMANDVHKAKAYRRAGR